MNNLLSYCGLVDLRINASDKDLPVYIIFVFEVSGIKLTKSTYLSFTAIKN